MQMPTPTDEHKRLHKLAGTWEGEETMSASPWGPGGKARGRSVMKLECDGFFVSQDYLQQKDGQISYRGHGLFGYDAGQKRFAWYWVDSMGQVPPAPSWGGWQGDTLTFSVESPQGTGRYTFAFQGNDRHQFTIENSFDGGKTWQTFMTADYRRQGGK
jgi:Protein of unknown function (DUF1579)